MFTPYNPCDDCKRKEMCNKCGYRASQINYERALNKIRELSAKLGKTVTIIK